MRWFILIGAVLISSQTAAGAAQPNVVFIAIDDQNDWIGCLGGHPQVKTPHIDQLAQRGTLFSNAHCQSPLCNPSRTSLMLGLRPTSTGIHGLAPWFRTLPEFQDRVTLPQALTAAGYRSFSVGKIYHGGYPPAAERAKEFHEYGKIGPWQRPKTKFVETPDKHPLVDWGPFPERDEQHLDYQIADSAIAWLKQKPAQPFFLAVGFNLPHVPCYAPRKWFDLYPEDSVVLPPVKADDRADTPAFSWYLHWKLPEPRLSWLQRTKQWRPLVRAYLASVSFMDAQVGRVLEALTATGQLDRTIIVLWSDHGWHLGEKGITGKNSLWERSTRVPLVFAGPGITARARCTQPVELLDLYPTVLELCNLPPHQDLEGHSLVPLLKDAADRRPWPAITSHNQGNHAVRSEHWRYISYADGSEELYDLRNDPNEWTNLANDSRQLEVIREHRRWLPKIDRPLAKGSAARILTYDPATGKAMWEGKAIIAGEKEE